MDQVEWADCIVDGVGSECLKNYISQERTLSLLIPKIESA